MTWATFYNDKHSIFEMFSTSHIVVLLLFLLGSIVIFICRQKLKQVKWRPIEIGIALSLCFFELAFHVWLLASTYWDISDSVPIELCSISLFLAIILLLTGNRTIYELLLFTALLGATQALITPVLYYDFPHIRFFYFFYTHIMMIWVALYFTWVKGYRPTIRSVGKVFVFLNILLPIVIVVNKLVDGNYMFLSHKPRTPSLLDYLGPYPWYILSIEGLLLILSLVVWLLLREKNNKVEANKLHDKS
ncbi:MAG: TIGR02206 family membrane protein [Bacillota bacterium]